HLSRRSERRTDADAMDVGPERGILAMRSGEAVLPSDHGPDLRLPGDQCGGATSGSIEPAAVDAEHDRTAEAVSGIRARKFEFSESREPEDFGVSAGSGAGGWHAPDGAVRSESEQVCAAGFAGSVGICGDGTGGDAGVCAVSDD